MKQFKKKCMAWLLMIVLSINLLPIMAIAAERDRTVKQNVENLILSIFPPLLLGVPQNPF